MLHPHRKIVTVGGKVPEGGDSGALNLDVFTADEMEDWIEDSGVNASGHALSEHREQTSGAWHTGAVGKRGRC